MSDLLCMSDPVHAFPKGGEHGFTGKLTIVTDYVREKKRRTKEVFVPLAHPPGHAQVDFGEALGEIGGVGPQDPLLRAGAAALGRVLREGVPCRDNGSLLL